MKLVKYFLAKTDPDTYTLDQFRAEGTTVWDGVKNAQALQAIRLMAPKDRVIIYHSGKESAIVGLAEVISAPIPDPKDPKSVIVSLKFLSQFPTPTTLSEVKASGLFQDFALVRQSRLSTMAAPDAFVAWLRERYPKSKI